MSTVVDNLTHVTNAFLCLTNRSTTMIEHSCDEWGLFKNPVWLLNHYFEKSGVKLSDSEKTEILVFLETKEGKEMTEAFLNPENRRGTEEEYSFNNEDFKRKCYLLIIHYKKHGGVEVLAKKENNLSSVLSR